LFIFIKQANGPSQHRPPPPPGRRATADVAVRLIQVVLAPECLSPLPSRTLRPVFVQEFFFFSLFFLFWVRQSSSVYRFARQDDVRMTHFSTTTTTSTLTSATLALRGYHLHVVLVGFYSSHNICPITMLQLRGYQLIRFYLRLILQSHRLWCSRCDCRGMLEYIW
jgi:hypothetical protein